MFSKVTEWAQENARSVISLLAFPRLLIDFFSHSAEHSIIGIGRGSKRKKKREDALSHI
jgi:hypothetical protein